MKKLIAFAVLFVLPMMLCFAANTDKPQQKSVSSQIRVIIPPFAIIHLGNNVTKAVPLHEVKQTSKFKPNTERETLTVESNKEMLTISESKTEKTATEIQTTTTFTSTQL